MKEQLKSVKIEATFEEKGKPRFAKGGYLPDLIFTGRDDNIFSKELTDHFKKTLEDMKEQKEPQEFAIHFTEKHHAEAFIEDMKKQGWQTWSLFFDVVEENTIVRTSAKKTSEITTVHGGSISCETNFTLPEQWKEALDFTAKQMQLYKELQKPKTKTKEEILEHWLHYFDLIECPLHDTKKQYLMNAMEEYAQQEAAIRIIEAIGTTTINKSKEQQIYEYFADNHDIQLLTTDIQEIERIVKEPDLCECGVLGANFLSNVCWKCKKFIY